MGLFSRRRPRVERLQRKGDVAGLCEALRYRDPVPDGDGKVVDLGRSVRLQAMSALREIDDERRIDCAVEALEDEDEEVQLEAARALREHASPELLIDCLVVSPGRFPEPVRAELHQALLARNDPSLALPFAEQLLRHGEDVPRAEDDRRFFDQLVERSPASYRQLVADVAAAALDADEEGRRKRAFFILSSVGDAGVEALEKVLDQPYRAEAARALGSLRASAALPALVDLLDDEEAPVRAAAARALGEIRDPRAVEGLLKGSTDAEFVVRDASSDALDRLGVSAVVFALAAFLPPLLSGPASEPPAPTFHEEEEEEEDEDRGFLAEPRDADSGPPVSEPPRDARPAISPASRPEAPLEWLLRAARRVRARR